MGVKRLSNSMLATVLALLATACACPETQTTPSDPELLRQSYLSSETNQPRQYLLYLPRGFREEPVKLWPVILFLHGDGEAGNGLDELDRVLIHGPLGEAWVQQRDLPFVMIGPQLPIFGEDWQHAFHEGTPLPKRIPGVIPPRPSEQRPKGTIQRFGASSAGPEVREMSSPHGWWRTEQDLLAMVTEVIRDFRGDPNRVYLTGLSSGGDSSFELAARYPERWAAVAPVSGDGDPATAPALAQAQLPLWAFVGGRDDVVPAGSVTEMIEAMNVAGHKSVRLTVHEDAGHLAWIRVYAGNDLYDWFLTQSRE